MKYEVGDSVSFKIRAVAVENKYGPKHDGKYPVQECSLGEIYELLEDEGSYMIQSVGRTQFKVLEADVLGKATRGTNGTWQVDS
jgi:hypothetical protein